MTTKNKKKRQHYVPRLVLRNFSLDKRRLSLIVLKDGIRRDDASLRDQCYRDYFYGKDERLEEAFKQQEDAFARVLGDLTAGHLTGLSKDDLAVVKFFVHYQRQRTLAAADVDNAITDTIFKMIAPGDPRVAAIDPTSRVKLRMPQLQVLSVAASALPFILDLDVKFILNDTPTGFIIGDDPVATYNQWAEHHPRFRHYRGYKGIAVKGLQWFFPASPHLCIALYDPTTYEYGSRDRPICRAGKQDVAWLNTLQAVHARDCLYFRPDIIRDTELVGVLARRRDHPPLRRARLREGEKTLNEDGTTGQIVGITTPDARIAANFHFVRVIDHSRYRDYDRAIIPLRLPQLYAAYRAEHDLNRVFTFDHTPEGPPR